MLKPKLKMKGKKKIWSTLDWISLEDKITEKDLLKNNQPILIVLPGITGDLEERYIKNIVYHGLKGGFNVTIYNNRLLSPHISFENGKPVCVFDEFDSAVKFIENKYPESKIFAIGFSYGACKLTKFIGTRNTKYNKKTGQFENRILAGVSVANPYDFNITSKELTDTVYDGVILGFQKKKLNESFHQVKKFEKTFNLELEKALNCNYSREFDEFVSRRIQGYRTADDYYRGISSVTNVKDIKVPFLSIQALDDNIATCKGFPFDEFSLNENIFSLTTEHGGHLIWIDNKHLFKLNQWVNEPAIEFISAVKSLI